MAQDLIGASPLRKEDRRLLVGAGRYLDDLRREDLAHLGVVRSAHAHADVTKIAAGQALGVPGVLGVWSAGDLPELKRPLVSSGADPWRPYTAPLLGERAPGGGAGRHQRSLQLGKIPRRPHAETVADALALVTVEYQPLPPVVSAEDGAAA